MADFRIERSLAAEGYRFIAGVDEVGRGALFGPVVAAAVILPAEFISGKAPRWLRKTNDSKLIPSRRRVELERFILAEAESVGVGFCTNIEIDEKNIYWASLEAMRRAVERMPRSPDFILVDGFELPGVSTTQRAVPQGDGKSYSIAAASIVAKVLRDRMMDRYDRMYSSYALGKNKGYGTRDHYKALDELGPTPFHRKSFKLQSERKLFDGHRR